MNELIEIIGYIGAILFALCGVPQAYQSYKEGHSKGVNSGFLGMWMAGELLTLVYVLFTHGLDIPLVMNYIFNIALISIIAYYKIRPRSNQ